VKRDATKKSLRRTFVGASFSTFFFVFSLWSFSRVWECISLLQSFPPTAVLGVGIDRAWLVYVNAMPLSAYVFELIEVSRLKLAAVLFAVIALACVCAGFAFVTRLAALRLVALLLSCGNILALIYATVEYVEDGFVNTTVFVHFDTALRVISLCMYVCILVYLFQTRKRVALGLPHML
jgi:hypothetical protein